MDITLWTVQTEEAYEEFKRAGVLFGTKEHIMFDDDASYKWMCSQMVGHNIPSERAGTYPIWAWYALNGKKPDLRTAGLARRGTKAVLIELRVQSGRVLLSDFDLWHCVLNDSFIAISEEEENKFFKDSSFFNSNQKKSWERIFELENKKVLDFYGISKETENIQAVLWAIRLTDVVSVRHFTAK